MIDWENATKQQLDERAEQVREAARLISQSPVFMLEAADQFAASEYRSSEGFVHELVATWMCHLAETHTEPSPKGSPSFGVIEGGGK